MICWSRIDDSSKPQTTNNDAQLATNRSIASLVDWLTWLTWLTRPVSTGWRDSLLGALVRLFVVAGGKQSGSLATRCGINLWLFSWVMAKNCKYG